MAAYLLALRERTTNPAELEMYGKKAQAAPSDNLKALAVYGKIETLEGAAFEGAVILEFPTVEDAQKWYRSPEYQAARQHRLKGADYRFLIVQGL